MLKSKNNEIKLKWVEVLQEITYYVPFETVQKKIFEEINDRGNAASSQIDQFIAMKILAVVLKVNEEDIPSRIPIQLLDKAKLFSQFEFKDVKLFVIEEIFELVIKAYHDNEQSEQWKDLVSAKRGGKSDREEERTIGRRNEQSGGGMSNREEKSN